MNPFPPFVFELLLCVIGLVTGILSALLGIGGGLIMVPVLTWFGLPLVKATATSLVAVCLSAASGSWQNLRQGQLELSTAGLLAIFGIFTAQLGAWLGNQLTNSVLALGFAILLLLTIYLMGLKRRLQFQEAQNSAIDPQLKPPRRPLLSMAGIGLLAGLLSGLFGVGGGVVMVPLQVLSLKQSIKAAIRTSLGAIVVIALAGIGQHAHNQNILWVPGLCLGLGGIVGAQFGARLLPKLSDAVVSRAFRGLLLTLAVYMVVRAFWST